MVELRIMAVRSRKDNVDALKEKLNIPDESIFYDDEGLGCIKNALKTWGTPTPKNVSHVVVLQDDVDVVTNFREIVEECASRFPDAIFGFYNYILKNEHRTKNSPYVLMPNCNVKGECMMIPTCKIRDYIDFYNKYLKSLNYPHDDATCRMFALMSDIRVFSTIPGLVKNLCPVKSVMGHNDPNHYSRVWTGYADVNDFKTEEYQIGNFFPIITHLPKNNSLNVAIKEKIRKNKLKYKEVY